MPMRKKAGVAAAGAGMAALAAGRKISGVVLFGVGVATIEREWRRAHPEFSGGAAERWRLAVEFYDRTHRHPVNRRLHRIGIPFIVAGAAGLLIFPAYRPLWAVSAVAFAGGWATNIIGHAVFEKNRPAFADDPLSFLAGPAWDLEQTRGRPGHR